MHRACNKQLSMIFATTTACCYVELAKICPTLLHGFVLLGKNRVQLQNLCPNFKFGQSVIFEFKSGFGLGLGLGIRVRVVRIFELFRVRTNSDNRTTRFGHRTSDSYGYV